VHYDFYPWQVPAADKKARSVSWLDGIKGDLNQALVLLGFVLNYFLFVVFIDIFLFSLEEIHSVVQSIT